MDFDSGPKLTDGSDVGLLLAPALTSARKALVRLDIGSSTRDNCSAFSIKAVFDQHFPHLQELRLRRNTYHAMFGGQHIAQFLSRHESLKMIYIRYHILHAHAWRDILRVVRTRLSALNSVHVDHCQVQREDRGFQSFDFQLVRKDDGHDFEIRKRGTYTQTVKQDIDLARFLMSNAPWTRTLMKVFGGTAAEMGMGRDMK